MRKIIVALAAASLALSGCKGLGLSGVPTSPSEVAQRTTADEQARLRCEQAYKLSRSIGEIGVDAGLVRGQLAVKAAELDRKAYAGLQACRTAYRLANSASLIAAADELDNLAGQIEALVKGSKN